MSDKYEMDQHEKRIDHLYQKINSLEDKFREIYRNFGEDEEISRICNEAFEEIRTGD